MEPRLRKVEDWFWACRRDGPAGDAFIIENGRDAAWSRVIMEIDSGKKCYWRCVNPDHEEVCLEHIVDMMLTVVLRNQVNLNKFLLEAAKIPAFAQFLRSRTADLCNYVSNSAYPDIEMKPEPYSDEQMRKLGRIVSVTLNIEEDWF